MLTTIRYLAAEFGGRVTVPEAQVDAFGQDHVPPVVGSFEDPITGKTIHFWTKPIGQLLEVSVATYAQETFSTNPTLDNLRSIDVVLGGDHGQGKFRAVIKIIMRFVGAGVEPIVVVIKVGHIEAKKDTYQILLNTVTPSMNEAIKRIKQVASG